MRPDAQDTMRPIHVTLDLWADDKLSVLEALESLCDKYRRRVDEHPIEQFVFSSGYENYGFSMQEETDARYVAFRRTARPDAAQEGGE